MNKVLTKIRMWLYFTAHPYEKKIYKSLAQLEPVDSNEPNFPVTLDAQDMVQFSLRKSKSRTMTNTTGGSIKRRRRKKACNPNFKHLVP